jgi:folate-binding protein YgfZ
MFAYNRGESIMVDTDFAQTEKILATFDHYIIMDDVEVTNLSEQLTALGVSGPSSGDVLAAAGFKIPEMRALRVESMTWQGEECTVVRGEDAELSSYEIWVAPERVRQLWDALRAAGGAPVGSEALEMERIVSGIPQHGIDIRERDLPQETEQARALNFNKGCYVGQEIVERIRSRGAVHRKFTGFVAAGSGTISAGLKVTAGGKDVGEITSAASLQVGGRDKTVALGYIRREVGVPGREVMIGETKAMVMQLPMVERDLLREENSLEQRPA